MVGRFSCLMDGWFLFILIAVVGVPRSVQTRVRPDTKNCIFSLHLYPIRVIPTRVLPPHLANGDPGMILSMVGERAERNWGSRTETVRFIVLVCVLVCRVESSIVC